MGRRTQPKPNSVQHWRQIIMTDAVEETTEGTATAEEVRTDNQGRRLLTGGFGFKIPDGHPDQGQQVDKTFEYLECISDLVTFETDQEAAEALRKSELKLRNLIAVFLSHRSALTTLVERDWNLTAIVNDKLKAGARSNAYQNALMPYRPSEVSQADIRARMIRDLIRSKVPEALAIKTIDAALATTQ